MDQEKCVMNTEISNWFRVIRYAIIIFIVIMAIWEISMSPIWSRLGKALTDIIGVLVAEFICCLFS